MVLCSESISRMNFCHFKRFQWFSIRRWCCSTLWLEDFDIKKSDDFTFSSAFSAVSLFRIHIKFVVLFFFTAAWSNGAYSGTSCLILFLLFFFFFLFDSSQNMMMSIIMGVSIQITRLFRLNSKLWAGASFAFFRTLRVCFFHNLHNIENFNATEWNENWKILNK